MPTYEYRCPNGHDFERFSKISESQSTLPCPVCGAVAERRISGGAGLVFKGSGFYITDYGKDGKGPRKADAEKPAAETKADSPKAEVKSESTPAPKADSKASAKPAKKAAPE